jgi:hypothetical protein
MARSNQVPFEWLDTGVADTATALTSWMRVYVAAPDKCLVATGGSGTAEELQKLFDDVMDYAYQAKLLPGSNSTNFTRRSLGNNQLSESLADIRTETSSNTAV